MEALKDLYSIYVNHYRADDSEDVTAAREKLEKCLGENYTKEVEDIAGDLGYFSNEQGFIEGFRYAASLFADGKAGATV